MYTIKDFLNTKSAGGPSFSASGDMLAYISNLTGTFQAFCKPTKGGDATQLTDFEDSLRFAVFSPTDDDLLIFGRDEGGNEKTQFYLLQLSTKQITSLTNLPDVIHHWGGWSRDGKYIDFTSTERNGTDFDVYTLNLETMEKTCVLAQGGWHGSLGFSPEGTMLVVSRAESNVNHDLFLIDLSNPKDCQHLTPHQGHATYGAVRWLPDESGFYLISNQDTDLEEVRFYDIKQRSFRP
ncbi:MAG TPA: DPP IV N-terminal domain-containing protein, partial [Candidatus Acidoferrum sp.]|nr:DPP IV N-terminal domain-containing protein [Candidatus Acidoferrum sp.]